MRFLPINKKEMTELGITAPDFVLVTGDAYIDHPSFGAAIIGRVLEKEGFSVCILPQPNYNDLNSFKEFGKPKLAFLVTSGNIDSMVNHYTATKKRRSQDLYSAGGVGGLRPDRAAIVYSQKIRAVYKDIPIILGGIEASLRRLAHYDYWDDKVRRSILHDSGADIVVYGMGETAVVAIAHALKSGAPISSIKDVRGTAYKSKTVPKNAVTLPSYNEMRTDKALFAKSFITQYKNSEPKTSVAVAEHYEEGYVIQNPPSLPLAVNEMDSVYGLSYTRAYHPVYDAAGGVPAINEVKFSIISARGCFGGCNFCALCFHGGRIIQPRSHESILKEARLFTAMKDFKGYIHDVGGPTANFRIPACKKQQTGGTCTNKKCLSPKPCANLIIDHKDYMVLLQKLRGVPKIKKVFIRSGIRYDYLIYDKNEAFFNELCKNHISGQLKVAPEHVSSNVLEKMGKAPKEVFEKFRNSFYNINKRLGVKQFLVPYLMSGHPGATLEDALELAEYLHKWGYSPEQVQDFYPTPATASTCMYYTGLDPFTMEKVYVCKDPYEKAMQRALIQYRLPNNRALVFAAIKKAGREDLIGFSKHCLIRPEKKGETEIRLGKPPKNAATKESKSEKAFKKQKKKKIRNIHKPHSKRTES